MSWHFMSLPVSQELEEESSAGCRAVSLASELVKSRNTLGAFFWLDSATASCPASQSGTTSAPSEAITPSAPNTSASCEASDANSSLPAAFHARTLVQPAKELASRAKEAGCGRKWHELSMKYDPQKSSWKTHLCLWEEDLPLSSVTLPKWGMMHNGVLWELTTLERPIAGNVSGSWATPSARDWKDTPGMRHRGNEPGRVEAEKVGSACQAGILGYVAAADRLDRRPGTGGEDGEEAYRSTPECRCSWWDEDPADVSNPTMLHEQGQLEGPGEIKPGGNYQRERESNENRSAEPGLGRVAHGVAHRVDRLKAIGNGQVPLVAATAWELLK